MSTDPGPQNGSDRNTTAYGLAIVLAVGIIFGFVVGILPGLVFGLLGMRGVGAVVTGAAWGGWYFYARWRRTGSSNSVMVSMAIANGVGALISALLFAGFTG